METYLYKNRIYYVLNKSLEDISRIQNLPLESRLRDFSSKKEKGREMILELGDKEKIISTKKMITTIITTKAIQEVANKGFYEIRNEKGCIVILDCVRHNLAY